ncbi:hypothetical protein CARUB_v10026421mg [Capsella rubella]|uniref:F-box domain-containing protein n=1 Tax=Capsella rubella TaxID=81985 RepID=R0EW20_9BRAS|nr:F-box protein At1g30790 [Capsella rubella]EOA13382.1 hypothetical protein CARUB_v10026421mg [Capsella rubella]
MAGECSSSESGVSSHASSSHEQQDKVGMRGSSLISSVAHHIPLDLTIEILTRLPARSLKRFQCVSKEWISVIRNRVFIDSFCSVSRTRSRFLVAVRIAENRVILLSTAPNETELPSPNETELRCCQLNPILYSSLHTYLEMTLPGLPVDLVHCSSIHGLFCLSHPSDPGRFTICNPSTRQVITLPNIKASSGRRRENISMFLGYDPVANEYKAFCSTTWHGEPFQEHKVLTIGGGKLSWRSIKGRITPRYTVVTNGICINGMLFYGVLTNRQIEKRSLWIIRFNLRGECIGSISTYPQVTKHGSLINYNGKLAAASPLPGGPLGSFELWVLDDFDNKRRWLRTQLNVYPLLLRLSGNIELKVLGMNKRNEVVLVPLKFPPKHEPLYIYYNNKGREDHLVRRVELRGFEEFGCNHTSEEKCVCQVLFSPEHFESLMSL